MATGYSGTPLAKKLGVKDGQRTWRFQMPAAVAQEIALGGAEPALLQSPASGLARAHVFVTSRAELSKLLAELRTLLTPDGMVWVSWP